MFLRPGINSDDLDKIVRNDFEIDAGIAKEIDRNKLFDECSYYKKIYSGVDDTMLLNALINKYVNMKLYKRVYMKNNKDFNQHREEIKEAIKYYDLLY